MIKKFDFKQKYSMNHITEFINERQFGEFIKHLGGESYIVGGYMREKYMKVPHTGDKDYVVTGIKIENIPFTKIVGCSAPVFLVKINGIKCEIALARTDKKNGIGYHGFEFHTSPNITIKDDLYRRDLTCNAIARNILTGEIYDPYNGISDIDNKILRCVSDESFIEDPLRLYRLARFAARFYDFKIDNHTFLMCMKMKDQLNDIVPERVFLELDKLLKYDNIKARRFFDVLIKLNCLDVHFKEINNLVVPDRHDGTSYEHTMRLLEHGMDKYIRFGLLVHDLGKGCTDKDLHPHHYNHEHLGLDVIDEFCDRLKIPNSYREFGILCCKEHMKIGRLYYSKKPGKVVRFVLKYMDKFLDDLVNVSYIDSHYSEGVDQKKNNEIFEDIRNRINIAKKAISEISGQDLIDSGQVPGPKLGENLLQERIRIYQKIYHEYKNELLDDDPLGDLFDKADDIFEENQLYHNSPEYLPKLPPKPDNVFFCLKTTKNGAEWITFDELNTFIGGWAK